jgi:hypothetical protein
VVPVLKANFSVVTRVQLTMRIRKDADPQELRELCLFPKWSLQEIEQLEGNSL